ncbi:unnamed protein product [Penicillium nalgiovense]|uniref:Uncharacterized protein n=1 Tax=Penicillium nalgiovense TaxID=60175 RepID=A0A9W4HNQ8_PENNA|nr:unnamed protein product [Penicillium nalgiovense]CAG8044565.1 unnamed protein product [Penicillium nalgiovense]CAG8065848.1 unnamed protein product [Penicillium nalgiovense]CAG8066851.1 unnamed protein product [Penicillium nalgiovense]CAG8094431.1 unnamed protein product [Penicillium nalgiovense]
MPSNLTFPAIIHIRDFIEHVEPDPTRPGKGLSMFFNEGNQSGVYKSNTFVYSSSLSLTTSSGDEGFLYCPPRPQFRSVSLPYLLYNQAYII